jgi:MraZ protein
MFLGQYGHNIDDKGRLTIPARFREQIEAGGAYITRGFEDNLMVFTAAHFAKVSDRINEMRLTDLAARQLKRLIFANAVGVEFDKSGRILIPSFLREPANLVSGAVVVGQGNYFEIWSPESWEKQNALLDDPEANAQRFAALDL